jgi:hypothetical protein
LGTTGRGKGSLVDLGAVERWRAKALSSSPTPRQDQEFLALVATALLDVLKRDAAHERVEISFGQASGLLVLAYQRIWQNLTRKPLDALQLPDEIKHLCTIYLEYRENL